MRRSVGKEVSAACVRSRTGVRCGIGCALATLSEDGGPTWGLRASFWAARQPDMYGKPASRLPRMD